MKSWLHFPVHRLMLGWQLPISFAVASPLSFSADLVKNQRGDALLVGDSVGGFKVAPKISEEGGARFMSGPGVWQTTPQYGVVVIRFPMRDFESGHQHELMSMHLDAGKPHDRVVHRAMLETILVWRRHFSKLSGKIRPTSARLHLSSHPGSGVPVQRSRVWIHGYLLGPQSGFRLMLEMTGNHMGKGVTDA